MSKDPTVLNVTQVFRREQRLWAVGKDVSLKQIGGSAAFSTLGMWGACFGGLTLIFAGILYIFVGMPDLPTSLIVGAIPGALIGAALTWFLNTPKEIFGGETLYVYLVGYFKWKQEARMYLDGYEQDPNINQIYRIDAEIQLPPAPKKTQ